MPKFLLGPPSSRLTCLLLIMMLAMTSQVWGQPGGVGQGGGMGGLMRGGGMGGPMDGKDGRGPGGGSKRRTPPRFDMSKATTITGQIESLESYGSGSWRSLPGLAVHGLILKTGQGNIEVYLGPPSFVKEQKFPLQTGDTLELQGFKVFHGENPAFYAAKVKKNNQTLILLGEDGLPLWKQEDTGGPGAERARRGGKDDSSQMGGGMMGGGMMGGGMGRGR